MSPDESSPPSLPASWPGFLALTLAFLWLTHAIAFFCHEFAHSFLAWALGWKHNPLALTFGTLTPSNLLAMLQIDEHVDYGPIFAAHHNSQAGIIAAAGAVLGNLLITLPVSLFLLAIARRRSARVLGLFAFLLLVMSIGNLIDYVPIRTFSPREDMHTVELGFHCSPWAVLIALGLPFAAATLLFLLRQPSILRWLLPRNPGRRILLAVLSAFLLFCFFGAAGWSSGPVSHLLSAISVIALFPLCAVATSLAVRRASA